METYTEIHLKARPRGGPINAELFDVVQRSRPTATAGTFVIKQTHMSLSVR